MISSHDKVASCRLSRGRAGECAGPRSEFCRVCIFAHGAEGLAEARARVEATAKRPEHGRRRKKKKPMCPRCRCDLLIDRPSRLRLLDILSNNFDAPPTRICSRRPRPVELHSTDLFPAVRASRAPSAHAQRGAASPLIAPYGGNRRPDDYMPSKPRDQPGQVARATAHPVNIA